ncbi:hypothetical protein EF903_24310 [Streptomyces sp. WAC05292]|nr:hypothetical protein EF903_24310 [Streptomyces sp. WAC05292]
MRAEDVVPWCACETTGREHRTAPGASRSRESGGGCPSRGACGPRDGVPGPHGGGRCPWAGRAARRRMGDDRGAATGTGVRSRPRAAGVPGGRTPAATGRRP